MKSSLVEQLVRNIDSKRVLLDYLRSHPKRLTMESFMCLAEILRKSGWILDGEQWCKQNKRLSLLEAAIVEMTEQISTDIDQILRNTVNRIAAALP
jgi:hypothetical protein